MHKNELMIKLNQLKNMKKLNKQIAVLYLNTEDLQNKIQIYEDEDELVEFIKGEVYEGSCLYEDEDNNIYEPEVVIENNVYSTKEFGYHHLGIVLEENNEKN